MKNIATITYYTILKYVRNPIALIVFILAPILITFTLTGSSDYKFTQNINKAQTIQINENLKNNIINPEQGVLNTSDKVCTAVIMLFLFYVAVLSSHSILYDLKNGINQRLNASPVTTMEKLLGKSLGNISLMAIYAIILIIITKYAFGIKWSGNIFIIFTSLLLIIIMGNSFGIIITGLSKNIYICALCAFIINYLSVYTVFIYSYSPLKLTGVVAFVNKYSFHNYTLKAIMGTAANNARLISSSLLILLGMSLAFTAASLVIGKKVLE